MDDFLVFTLCGPMAAFGGHAGHQWRGTEPAPGRSSMLGLLGAALGIERGDEEGWRALRRYGTATRVLTKGAVLRDYHTVQTVPRKFRRPDGRRAAVEAAGPDLHTLVTLRDYRLDVAIVGAVWGTSLRWPLPRLAQALRTPAFVLYLGRKSCPPAAPLAPAVVRATDPVAALRSVEPPWFLRDANFGAIASDPFPGGQPHRIEHAPVEPLDRLRRHFGQGEVWYFDPEAAA